MNVNVLPVKIFTLVLICFKTQEVHSAQLLVLPKGSAALLCKSSVLETINLYSSASLCKTVQI